MSNFIFRPSILKGIVYNALNQSPSVFASIKCVSWDMFVLLRMELKSGNTIHI